MNEWKLEMKFTNNKIKIKIKTDSTQTIHKNCISISMIQN